VLSFLRRGAHNDEFLAPPRGGSGGVGAPRLRAGLGAFVAESLCCVQLGPKVSGK
jgi:hypothetical protein